MVACSFVFKAVRLQPSEEKAYGGVPFKPDLLPVPVSLTRSGYPRIIPPFHRLEIYKKNERSDLLVKVYLSFFSLATVICLAKKIDKTTFDQTKPLDSLVGSKVCFSFDLKAATERWPLLFLFEVLQTLFDRSFASSVVNSTLACNIFDVPFVM